MELISRPAPWRARIAVSRPAHGPLTSTLTSRTQASNALAAAFSAAAEAANGVPFFVPLKPEPPAEAQATMPPVGSVIETIVLLKVAWMWATPDDGICLFVFFFLIIFGCSFISFASSAMFYSFFSSSFFLPRPTVFLLPRRVRALVRVRWPRAGRPLRWRVPRYVPVSISRLMLIETSRRRSPSTLKSLSASRRASRSLSFKSLTLLAGLRPALASSCLLTASPTPYIYVRPTSTLLFGGRSTPAKRTIYLLLIF